MWWQASKFNKLFLDKQNQVVQLLKLATSDFASAKTLVSMILENCGLI